MSPRNILQVISNGDQARVEKSDIFEPIMFWDVIREVQRQGMSMKQEDVEANKRECIRVLQVDI